jgi:hypothetical protein
MRPHIALWLVALTILAMLPRLGSAELVRFDITGTLQSKTGLQPIPGNSPSIGAPFTGSFIFDTSAMDNSDSVSFGIYHTPVPPSLVALKVGDWEWTSTTQSPTNIVVGNDLSAPGGGTEDSYEVGHSRLDLLTPDEPNPTFAEYWLFRWALDGPNTIFSDKSLPQQAFPLAPWTTNRWSISQWGTPPAPLLEFSGAVGSFTSAPVPEPGTCTLLVVGGLAALVRRRNRC